MKVVNVKQGSREWLMARLGVPTASCFDKIITPGGKTGKDATASKSSAQYMRDLLTEFCIGHPLEGVQTLPMLRGSEMESEAVAFYELERNVDAQAVGFCTDDAGSYGCSPDRLIGEDGMLEVKCPTPQVHLGYLYFKDLHAAYRPQLQGQMYVTGRKWVDIISYCPMFSGDAQACIIRVDRDEEYISILADLLDKFCNELADHRIQLQDRGYIVPTIEPPEFLTEEDGEQIIAAAFSAA